MTLTLEITAPSGANPGPTRHVFNQDGGTIGRAAGNSCVLPHNNVSRQHVVISFRNGVFYIEDTSQNGVSVNSLDNRLVRNRPYALKQGDQILIEPYVISVSIGDTSPYSARRAVIDPFAQDDPFAHLPSPSSGSPILDSPEAIGGDEVDPLKFFDPLPKSPVVRQQKRSGSGVDDLLGAHYEPPAPLLDVTTSQPDAVAIPPGYDPLADDHFGVPVPVPPPRRRPAADPAPGRSKPRNVVPEPPVASVPPVRPGPAPVGPAAAAPAAGEWARDDSVAHYFEELLSGAGLHGAAVTPELARNFGQILRVVVSGLMDVLQARQRIKEEFRIRQTTFRLAGNNPLKFSANVDDALHNLLVKRNPAYLNPVDAFVDAFEDLRNHQLAMLVGIRTAFEAMLAEFDPERLQEEFDHQLGKGSLAIMPAKLRYWDLYREKRRAIVQDMEAAFNELFGEEFARAYEEQFRRLKAEGRSGTGEQSPGNTRPPQK